MKYDQILYTQKALGFNGLATYKFITLISVG